MTGAIESGQTEEEMSRPKPSTDALGHVGHVADGGPMTSSRPRA